MATKKSAAKAAKKAMHDVNNIKDGTVEGIEELALEMIKFTLDKAHETDGFRGVIQFCLALIQEADQFNLECSKQGMDERAAQAATAYFVGTKWGPLMAENFDAIIEMGGGAQFKDASHEEIAAAVLAHNAAKAASAAKSTA